MKKIIIICAFHTLFGKCLIDNSKNVGIVQQQKFETICYNFLVPIREPLHIKQLP